MATTPLRIHYAVRLLRSILHLGQSVWQPLCKISDTNKIRMSTRLRDVTCKNCRTQLVKHKRKFGLSKQINRILREGAWYEPED